MPSKRLLLFEELTAGSGKKVYAGGYSEIVLCTEGGDVEVCRAICEYLLRHPKLVTVTGRCQSAGVLVAACGKETQAYPGVEWLHHECSGEIDGRPSVVRAHADFMRRADEWANQLLEERTGRPASQWREDALQETVFTNAEALEWGLLDREV